jgi:hypothetical protein
MSHRQKFMFGLAFVPAIALMTIGSVTRAVLNGDLVNNTWNISHIIFGHINAAYRSFMLRVRKIIRIYCVVVPLNEA